MLVCSMWWLGVHGAPVVLVLNCIYVAALLFSRCQSWCQQQGTSGMYLDVGRSMTTDVSFACDDDVRDSAETAQVSCACQASGGGVPILQRPVRCRKSMRLLLNSRECAACPSNCVRALKTEQHYLHEAVPTNASSACMECRSQLVCQVDT